MSYRFRDGPPLCKKTITEVSSNIKTQTQIFTITILDSSLNCYRFATAKTLLVIIVIHISLSLSILIAPLDFIFLRVVQVSWYSPTTN